MIVSPVDLNFNSREQKFSVQFLFCFKKKYTGKSKCGLLPGNAFSCSCDNGANGGRTGVGDTSGIMLTSPGRFAEYGSRITFMDVHLNEYIKIKKKEAEEESKNKYWIELIGFNWTNKIC